MGLRLILGRAGTGKTYTCLQEISQECRKSPTGTPLVLITPEQATFQMEYDLNTAFGLEGTVRAQVFSFGRLAYRLLAQVGGQAGAPVDSLRKQLELEKLQHNRKEKLRVLKQSAGEPGFSQELAGFITEMKSFHISPSELKEKAEFLFSQPEGKLTAEKLIELSELYADWEATGLVDPADFPDLVAKRLRETDIYRDAKVWIDGFREFTPQELGIISFLLAVAPEVNVTFCCDQGVMEQVKDNDLFYPTNNTLAQLLAISGRSNLSPETDLLLQVKHRFNRFPEGAFLEESFVNPVVSGFSEDSGNITLKAAVNRRAELEGAAREILRLCREEGYRFRDICVITRDISLYQELFPVVFADYNIPYHLEEHQNLSHHPLVELIRSALETVISDWSYEPVFRYLKTDLAQLSPEQVDGLENYVLEHGIKGKTWFEASPWTYVRRRNIGEDEPISAGQEKDLAYINDLRKIATKPLRAFQLALAEADTARAYSIAVVALLEELKVRERLAAWSKNLEVDAHGLAWEKVLDLFDTLVNSLGEGKLPLQQYARLLVRGLEDLKLPRKLPGMDEVLICSPDKCFNPKLKAVILIGLNEGVLPARIGPTGLLTEAERVALRNLGLNLAPGITARAFAENFIVYLGLTRSSEKLWLSYSLADLEGKAQRPSPVVRKLKEIFPKLEESLLEHQPPLREQEDHEFVASPKYSLNHLAGVMREAAKGAEIPPLWWDVYNWAVSKPEWRQTLEKIAKGLKHTNTEQNLSQELARELFGSRLKISVTKIEKYKACPFAHFATYGLRLKERQKYSLDAAGMGDLFHAALKQIGLRLWDLGLDWADLDNAQCHEFAVQAIEELSPQLRSEILLSSERYKYLTQKLIRVLHTSVWALSEQAKRGSFRPYGYEVGFGEGEEMPAIFYHLEDGITLELIGRIDRIDTITDRSGRTLVRIIDYKSGKPGLSLDDMYYGLKLQLLTYLQVAVKASGEAAVPAGFLYFYLSDPVLSERGPLQPEERDKKVLKEFKMKGFVVNDHEIIRLMEESCNSEVIPAELTSKGNLTQWSTVLDPRQYDFFGHHLEHTLRQAAAEIINGNVAISPYKKSKANACTYCKLKPVCRFDLLLPENKFRNLRPIPKKNFWQEIKIPEGVG